MGQPAARATDMHVCPMVTPGVPPIPHVGGPILPPCSTNVFTGKLPQARMTDKCVCVGPMDIIVKGSAGVFVNKLPAARIGDTCAHGGTIVLGCFTVLIGETKGGGGGGGGGGAGSSQNDYTGGEEASVAWAMSAAQATTLTEASADGSPFCEVCFGKDAGG